MLGNGVRGHKVNRVLYTVVTSIFQNSVLIDGSSAWAFGQRHSAGRLRRRWRDVGFRFPQGEEEAGAAGDMALPPSGSSLLTACSSDPGESKQVHFCLYPDPNSKGDREEKDKCTFLRTQSCLEDTFMASRC